MNDGGKASIVDRFGHLRDMLTLVDWSGTPLGEPMQWAESLCSLVRVLGVSPRPMLLAWGGDHTLLYNQACADLLGDRHPGALGRAFSKVFAGRDAAVALAQIRAGHAVDIDGPEQAFRCTCTPITSEEGGVVGFIATDFLVRLPASTLLESEDCRADAPRGLPVPQDPAHYRQLFERADQPMCILEVTFAEDDGAVDACFIDANPCFEAHTGLIAPFGKTVLDLLPDVDAFWLQTFAEVVSSGRARRFRHEAFGRSLEVFASPVGHDPEARLLAVVFRDVSELDRQTGNAEFLADLSRDFARLPGVQETLATVAPKLAAHLGVERVTFAEVDAQAVWAVVLHEYHLSGFADARAPFKLADFMTVDAVAELEVGGTVAVANIAADPRTAQRVDAWRQFGAGAMVQVPHQGGERLQFLLGVYRSGASEWRASDLELLRAVAVRLWLRLERARVADALLESQARLRRLLRAAKIIAWEWDAETRRLTTFPEILVDGRHAYFDPDNLTEAFRGIHPEDRSRTRDLRRQAFRDRQSYVLVYRSRPLAGDAWLWVEESGRPDDAAGEGQRFFGVLRDITQAREMELKLDRLAAESARQQRRHAAIMASTPDHIYMFDRDLRLAFANAALLELFGSSWEEVAGRHISRLGMPSRRARHEEEVRRVLATTEPVHGELQFVGDSGLRVFAYVLTPLFNGDGEVEGVIGTSREVTEQKRVETALVEADARKDEFLALLSHELRNPLAAIQLCVHVMGQAQPGSGPARQAQEIIGRQASQLTRLVGDLLDVNRIARGKVRLTMSRVDLVELARNTVIDQQALFDVAGTQLLFHSKEDQLYIDGDADRLAQVLGNLLQNAAKFARPGGHTWVTVASKQGGGIEIHVRDDGIGIDADTLGTLFEPFVQGAAAMDQAAGGLGLGLALVRGLVELHGGEVDVSSPGPGQGATFVVTLPASARGLPEPEPVASETPAVSRMRALVIEDICDVAAGFGLLLEGAGHAVVIANDGESGLASARRMHPDVIFCDLAMSGMDGYAVARAIRQDPALCSTLLIAVSGHAGAEDIARAEAAGFDRHLAKPPDIGRVNALLAGRGRA